VVVIPTKCGLRDKKGAFCRWGSSGKKYYYNPSDKGSKERARKKANKQGQAIAANKSENSEKVVKNTEKESKCVDCEPKLDKIDEIDQKTPKNDEKVIKSAENLQEMAQNDIKTEENEQILAKNDEKTVKNNENEGKITLKAGDIIGYNGKIGKILGEIKHINYVIQMADGSCEVVSEEDLTECDGCEF